MSTTSSPSINKPGNSAKAPDTVAKLHHRHHKLLLTLHLLVLLCSVILIVMISYDSFRNISFIADEVYMKVQFWICLFFIFDIAVEFCLTNNKRKYMLTHLLFLLVSIPYLNIISFFNIDLSVEMRYLLRFLPMLRAAYVLAVVMGVLSTDRISSMFAAYIGLLVSTVYFASLLFFIEEHYINPGVDSYWSALWWSFMDVTTVGCNINAITPTGKVLAVILAAEGLILFPVFTVYITNALNKRSAKDRLIPSTTSSAA